MNSAQLQGSTSFSRQLWRAPRAMRGWLGDDASLTARIRARCDAFSLRLLGEARTVPAADERAVLGLRDRRPVWLREVLLQADGVPVVYAHSLLASAAIPPTWRLLRGLGGRPLAAVLFDDPRVTRAPLSAARLDARDPRWLRACLAAGLAPAETGPLWARRSVFRHGGVPLLVTEIFLPAIERLAL
ncbi:MAG: chorismate lyase [Zoogloea sp.]|nr:chorismate lyase [Zoogloea sp.]